ncbi:hypothetical protein HAZT_HAZT007456, partial [Hyalella azteca]
KPSWEAWKSSLSSASAVSVPRSYTPAGFHSTDRQLHVFCDASEEAIGYAIYLRSQSSLGEICVSLVMGNSMVAPRGATSIPRLELCAAVEAARAAEETVLGMQSKIGQVHFHCDSMVVLGYLTNETKRFSRYVTRRISAILKISKKHQWHFVSTNENPADIASRPHDPDSLANTIWFSGPEFLYNPEINYPDFYVESGLPEEVSETDGAVSCMKTSSQRDFFVHEIVRRTSNWNRAKRLVARVACMCFRWLDKARNRLGIKVLPRSATDGRFAEHLLILSAQKAAFPEVFLRKAQDLPENHVLSSLSPFIDANGLIRYLADQFWTRWRDEQIDNLRHRRKWKSKRRNIKEGDIVLVKDKCLKRNDWPIGRVTAVKTSRDGLVRSAFIDILTRGVNRRIKSFERPICNLVFLTES